MAPRWKSRSAGPLRSSCLYLLLPTVGPPFLKHRKRSRNKRLSSPGLVVSQLLPWLLPTGIPYSERLLGRPLGPKLYATAMAPIDLLLQWHYRTFQAEHLFLVYLINKVPHQERGMWTQQQQDGTIGSMMSISVIAIHYGLQQELVLKESIKLGPVQLTGLPQKNQSRQSSDSPEMIASFTIASEFNNSENSRKLDRLGGVALTQTALRSATLRGIRIRISLLAWTAQEVVILK
ncbi:hypothetical protein Tco_0741387 [Tanacetum coccineum]